MINYHFDERKISKTVLAVDFGTKGEWLENMLADMHAMFNAIINTAVTKYIPDEGEQEVAVGVIKAFIIDDLIESDTDLEGFREMVLGYRPSAGGRPEIPQFNSGQEVI